MLVIIRLLFHFICSIGRCFRKIFQFILGRRHEELGTTLSKTEPVTLEDIRIISEMENDSNRPYQSFTSVPKVNNSISIIYSLFSFLVVGLAFGIAAAGWYYERFQHVQIPRVDIPWYVLLGLGVILLIEIAQIFSMLKAVKREFMQFDPDN